MVTMFVRAATFTSKLKHAIFAETQSSTSGFLTRYILSATMQVLEIAKEKQQSHKHARPAQRKTNYTS